jgi:FtsP/CotA-like multicopper oxidase with cupredoxin domain
VVRPKDPFYFPPADKEEVLFLSDLPMKNGVITLRKDQTSHSLMGQYGNVMLVNGSDQYTVTGSAGDTVRLYVVNSANVRPFNFAIEGLTMKLVGGDSGAYEQGAVVDAVLLNPSERAIVDILIPKEGTYRLVNKTPTKTYVLGTLVSVPSDALHDNSYSVLESNEDTVKSVESMKKYFNVAPQKTINLSIDMHGGMMGGMNHTHGGMSGGMMGGMGMQATTDGIEWEDGHADMNAMSNVDSLTWKMVDAATGKSNMDVNWEFKKDVPVKIRIFNDPMSMHPMQHPVHFHGQRFLVLDRDGVRQTNLVWKDTVLVRSGETVDILLDPSNPGIWMAHCHISEHLEAGMMISFTVK